MTRETAIHKDQIAQIYDALKASRKYVETCADKHNGNDGASVALRKLDQALAWFNQHAE